MTKLFLYVFLIIVFIIVCNFTLTNAIEAGQLKEQGINHTVELLKSVLGMFMAGCIGWVTYWVDEHE